LIGPADLRLLEDLFIAALREDVGHGDITTSATIPADAEATADYIPKQDVVAAGLAAAARIAEIADARLQFKALVEDGASVPERTSMARLQGPARSILVVERVTLNFLQRMCGIATRTRQYVERVQGTKARIVDTRKTAPGLRILDKYAVACGGAMNHRMGLFDGVLIKNNHLKFHSSLTRAVQAARDRVGHLAKVEVEIAAPDGVEEAVAAGADVILLDNLTPEQTREAVILCRGRVPLESSGGITLENVRDFAEAGVDYISIGALTHSVTAADIHLRVVPA
jgi:nicotinate-nucleotide pyrophosphorylase (carboxylating)